MGIHAVGSVITTELNILFQGDGAASSFYVAPDETPTAVVSVGGVQFQAFSAAQVTKISVGRYSISWTPATPGTYSVVWSFAIEAVPYTVQDSSEVLMAATASSSSLSDPDVGLDNICTLTGTFVDAGGNYVKGVHVRFSPVTTIGSTSPFGHIAQAVSAVSGTDGSILLRAVRGVSGLLTITHTGIVRRVTIPDQATKDIFELAGSGDDVLEVQKVDLVELPRRS